MKKADYVATRAITIHAGPGQVWPWLVQIGSGRAGWYSYDCLDNAGVPSAAQIIPELQQLAADDLVPMVAGEDIGVWVTRHPWTRRMLYEVVAANGDIVMIRRMLRGIKERAERLAADPAPVDGSPSS